MLFVGMASRAAVTATSSVVNGGNHGRKYAPKASGLPVEHPSPVRFVGSDLECAWLGCWLVMIHCMVNGEEKGHAALYKDAVEDSLL